MFLLQIPAKSGELADIIFPSKPRRQSRRRQLTSSSLALGGRSLCLVIDTNFCNTFGVLVPNLGCWLAPASTDLRGEVGEVGAATAMVSAEVGSEALAVSICGVGEARGGGRAEEEASAGVVEVLSLRGGVGAEAVVDGGLVA